MVKKGKVPNPGYWIFWNKNSSQSDYNIANFFHVLYKLKIAWLEA